MRLFFAIELSTTLKQSVQRAIDAVRIRSPSWRWVATDNFHFTMKFLGEMPDGSLSSLVEAACAACKGVGPFEIGLGKLGGFPSLQKPRVIFYEATGQIDVMTMLAARLDRSLVAQLGMEEERRPFRAHLTIARVNSPLTATVSAHLMTAPLHRGPSQRIQKLSLMRSHLSPKGAQYQCLKEIAL